ncbi:hypothetical protein D3H65_15460 [Paraflavitalea soli]|uniref:Tetratricopeptide repeat protein n=1 Tax=Paraflavitalea soli TaxID=2315862 RepID=A0A3B7MUI9_9BACT|nr:hypothetical protein [Paraflavitalea soli]AXY75295.1 hypothetical protein D3H65_15460 [Paraflavitalea soli]
MRLSASLLYSSLLLTLFAIGCTEPEKPATKEEAAQLARSLENSMNKKSAAKFNEALDVASLQKRIQEAGSQKIDTRIVDGAMKELKSGQLGSQIIQALGKTGTYQLVKQYEKDKNQHLVFRMYANSKLNYHDLEVIKKKDQVKISDVFIYMTGENLSATLAESALLMTENLDNLTEMDKNRLNNIKRIRQLINQEEYTKAQALYKELPAVLKQTKLFQMMYVQIAAGLGNDEYLKAMTDYKKSYPNAANVYLLMIDAYILKEEYDNALQAVNQLDSLINKDPFLDYYRGLIYKMTGNKAKQLEHFESLNASMPGFSDGTLELLITYLDAEETDKAVALVTNKKSNYKKIDKEQRETIYSLYPEFKKQLGADAD